MEKTCLTTFVYGDRYIAYIPFVLYSCQLAYPEYDIKIFVYGQIDNQVRQQIDIVINKDKSEVIENSYSDFEAMSPLISKTIRWILWDDRFRDYDYLYTIDIDMLYIAESIPLHEQHKQHMQYIGLPFSNIKRQREFNSFSFYDLGKGFKELGIKHALRCLGKKTIEYKLTGLHFVSVEQYYSLNNLEIIKQAEKQLKNGKYLRDVFFPNNEIFLYKLVEKMGFDMRKIALQKNPITMLCPDNPLRQEFRPHHGVHLGCFVNSETMEGSKEILQSATYQRYVSKVQETFIQDPIFIRLLSSSSKSTREIFSRVFSYYGIEQNIV